MPLLLSVFRFLMRLRVVNPRFLVKAGSVLVVWLLSASVSYAAATPGRVGTGRACAATAAKLQKLLQNPKSFGGPVAPKRTLLGLTDITALLTRGARAKNLASDDEAIQNDAPAARIDADDRPLPTLRPLGVLHASFARLPRTRAFSPRSPRGPPTPT
jgi:hypothetical protein